LSGSEWAWVTHGHLGGRPPKADLAHEKALGALLAKASRAGHVSAAHDVSDGGLAQVLVESCLRRNIGARMALPEPNPAFVWLFSESAGRVVVAVPRGHDKAFRALAEEHNVSCTAIGVTAEEPVLEVQGEFSIPLDELRVAYTATLRDLFGGPAELANRHGDPERARHPEEPEASLADAPTQPVTEAAEEEREQAEPPARTVTLELTEPAKAEPAQPEAAKPEPAMPEPAMPEPTRPEAVKPEAARPEPAKPEPARPEAEAATPEPARPEAAKPEAATPGPAIAEPAKPEPAEPGAAEPDPAEVKAAEVEAAEVEAAEVDAPKAEAADVEEANVEPVPAETPAAETAVADADADAEPVTATAPVPDEAKVPAVGGPMETPPPPDNFPTADLQASKLEEPETK
jgi:phosphoribosylformylglycinamidine synthase